MMRTRRILECQAVEGATLGMAMTMMTGRVRKTGRAVRKGLGTGREHRMGRAKGRRLRTERGKERGRGRETVKGKVKVLLNKP